MIRLKLLRCNSISISSNISTISNNNSSRSIYCINSLSINHSIKNTCNNRNNNDSLHNRKYNTLIDIKKPIVKSLSS